MPRATSYRPRTRGFTLTEVMVVIGLIIVLLAILLPALANVRMQGIMGNSISNLRQVAAFMQVYSSNNRDTVLPSQFDYNPPEFRDKGMVRSQVPPDQYGGSYNLGGIHEGTWADILWHTNELSIGGAVDDPTIATAYRFCAPDRYVYETDSGYRDSPFRSMALNSRDYMIEASTLGDGPTPYGSGATEAGLPGYFAANDFFNARPDAPDEYDADGNSPPPTGRWFSTGQIRAPARSMYLVDSFAGAVISPGSLDNGVFVAEAFDNTVDPATGYRSIQVDFRYNGNALMLFLDGHIDPVAPWEDLEGLQAGGTKVQHLDRQ